MQLTIEQKKEYFKTLGKNENDSGTPDVQVAIFTQRIKHLTEHLKRNKKDFATERSLIRMVGKRKKLLAYIKNKDIERYRELIKKLEIRK
ncbi:MAG: 30S ribosomal protein S15 [Marinilabiliales bacterium]|nr:MAG: 30S ribosomal protein S15 [Marinilabiliales bacterium]